MYSYKEMARLRETFWTTFGKYMAPVPSAEGDKINWVNYKTGVKNIRLVLELNDNGAVAGIVISHPDNSDRLFYYQKMLQLKTMFQSSVEGIWLWKEADQDEAGRTISRVYTTFPGKSITKQEDWADIISFFKTTIIALDGFWQMVKDGFEV